MRNYLHLKTLCCNNKYCLIHLVLKEIQKMKNLRYEINAMGTILESDSIDAINTATKQMMETVHNLGILRVEINIKIDSRLDKHVKMEEKLKSIKKQMS